MDAIKRAEAMRVLNQTLEQNYNETIEIWERSTGRDLSELYIPHGVTFEEHIQGARMSDLERIYADLSKEIVIARDGLTIGGKRFPGVVAKDGLAVTPPSGDDPLWMINLTLITDTPPKFVGTFLLESGEVEIVDEEQS